jgi:hypothetical protein
MATLSEKVDLVLHQNFDIPSGFVDILKDAVENDNLNDLIFVEPVFKDNNKKNDMEKGAILLLTTRYGVVLAEAGTTDTSREFGGYKVRYIPYKSICSVELDTCLLLGIFRIILNSGYESNVEISFLTSEYYKDFKNLIQIIKLKLIE